jgi:uncharacterized membrane protein YbhN (UPF0104 family)
MQADDPTSAPATRDGAKRRAWLILKTLVTLAAFAWLLHTVDTDRLGRLLMAIDVWVVVAALLLVVTQTLLLAWRWHRVVGHLGGEWALGPAVRWTFVGVFFNQALPSSVGGDAIRIWALNRRAGSIGLAVGSVFVERASGLAVIGLMVSAATLALDPRLLSGTARLALLCIGPLATAGFVATLLLTQPLARSLAARWSQPWVGPAQDLLRVFAVPARLAELMLVAAAAAALNFAAAWLIGRSLGADIGPIAVVALAGGASLLALIPVSLGGWGVREGAMVALLVPLGVPAETALATSVAWALLPLLVSLPAGLLWWATDARREPGDNSPLPCDAQNRQ